jgi:hypothetical protein
MVNQLKKDYPKTWAKFLEYLRINYEFWDNPTSENTLWFCERDFKMQLGYFFGWFDEIKAGEILDYEDELDEFEEGNMTSVLKNTVVALFKTLENRENL